MTYDCLLEIYETERIKVISVWSMFTDGDLPIRPHAVDPRGRSVHEHLVHQCVSEDVWFRTRLGIDVAAPPLPSQETRMEFMKRYAEDSAKRLAALRAKDEPWWEEEVPFFDVQRSRAWHRSRLCEMTELYDRQPGNGAHRRASQRGASAEEA
jgi:hypothetical protein